MGLMLIAFLIVLPMMAFALTSVLAGLTLKQSSLALRYSKATKSLAWVSIVVCPLLLVVWCTLLIILLATPG